MISATVLRDIRDRVRTAHTLAGANNRRLSVAQQDRADLLREVDRLNRELALLRAAIKITGGAG